MLSRSDLTNEQRQAIEHIKLEEKCALWLPMGAGKTGATLTALNDLRESFDVSKTLVAAPLRVARDVWHKEIETWEHLKHLKVSRIVGNEKQRLKALSNANADIYTINRENLAWLFRGYVEEVAPNRFKQIRHWPFSALVLDEAQSYRNPAAQRTQAVHRLSTFGLCQRIVELTGTPAPRGYEHLWAQLFALDHGKRLGATQEAYLNRFFEPPPDWGFRWQLREKAADTIHNRIDDIVLSLPDTQPPVPVNWIPVKLPPKVLHQYNKLAREALLDVDETRITAVNAGVLIGKLLQLSSGAVYHTPGSPEHVVFHDSKLDALIDRLDEMLWQGPVVIAYCWRHEITRLGAKLDKYCTNGQKWSLLQSEKQMQAFEAGEIDFGLIHPASGGHGLNSLYRAGAKNLIWIGPTPDYELFAQLNARLAGGHRRGEGVNLHVLLAQDTYDYTCRKMLEDKGADEVALMRAMIRSVK